MIWNWIGGLFILILYLWAASQACRFFVEARRSGLLELLLATPLNERQIVAGQWRALLRMFGLPVLLLLGVHVAGSTLSQLGFHRIASRGQHGHQFSGHQPRAARSASRRRSVSGHGDGFRQVREQTRVGAPRFRHSSRPPGRRRRWR